MKNVLVVLLLIVAAAAGFVALQPSDFIIIRSRTVAAPPGVVHRFVNDFHQWAAWSPWEKIDPEMRRDYSGPPSGPGATYHWVGNEQVGEGQMTITDSHEPDSVTIRLEFLKPFPATNTAQFDIVPGGLGTDVTWSMTGRNNFVAKAFGLFMNMDKLVGADFEKGLAELDTVTAAATPPPPPPEPEPALEGTAPGEPAAAAEPTTAEPAAPTTAEPAAPAAAPATP